MKTTKSTGLPETPGKPESPSFRRRLAWMVGIWLASVLALGAVTALFRLALRL